jgi:hypothetical protein
MKQLLIFTSYFKNKVKLVQSTSGNLAVSYMDFSTINLHCFLQNSFQITHAIIE